MLYYVQNKTLSMNKKFIYFSSAFLLAITLFGRVWFLQKKSAFSVLQKAKQDREEEEESKRASFVYERWKYEYDMIKDPATGGLPKGIYEAELALAKTIPLKDQTTGLTPYVNNNYIAAGPINQGGRTRAVAFDKRFGTIGNQVIIAGAVSGGIFRSTDGGTSWAIVSPENDIRNVTALVQDPRAGFEDTWYAGGGEPIGNSASEGFGALYLGQGIWKSTNNGATWDRLTLNITGLTPPTNGFTLEAFDNPFDYVHKLAVNPTNGHLYVCGHRRLIRSTDGGNSFDIVFAGTKPSFSDQGQMDVTISNAGLIVLGVNGGFTDANLRGVWISTTGNNGIANWVHIAGGQTAADSLNNWRGNDYTNNSKRILLALAPSNQNILYVCYENGLSQAAASGAKPEVDLYKLDLGAGTYVNLSANMPDFPGQINGIDPIATQGGYDILLVVKPDNPLVVFVGGTNLYRSTDGFTTTANTEWIGGYEKNAANVKLNPPTHPDMHALVFDPTNPNRAVCANDGGLQVTDNILANNAAPSIVNWVHLDNYQTLQYYHVAIDPSTTEANFIGGAQDNGSYVRQQSDPIPNKQIQVGGGDGCATAIALFTNDARLYYSSQKGSITRAFFPATGSPIFTSIRPASGLTASPGGGYGDFVTYFKMDFDNPEDLYYVNYNKIFRTTNASTVTTVGYTYMQGIATAINPANPDAGTDTAIRALELSRGPYLPSHALYIGTDNGQVFRLDDPRNAPPTAIPVNITPSGIKGYVSDIAVNPNNDEEIMVTASSYNATSVYWTRNAKAATPIWKNAEGNLPLPSFRSCMIVLKKDINGNPVQEYYVGTSVGLYSATNIGPTLEAGGTVNWLREGGATLGFSVIQSMDYRPQDNTLLLGTHGNGMYFTNVGTPNFQPNTNGGILPSNPSNVFISKLFPTVASNQITYVAGNLSSVNKILVQIFSSTGQLVFEKQNDYQTGVLNIQALAKGAYVLFIASSDGQQKFVQKFVKQ
jgi:hypothetical protein